MAIRVIVVDGAAEERRKLCNALAKTGFEVRSADSAGGVSAVLAEGGADIAIIDAGPAGEPQLLAAMQLRLATQMGVILLVNPGNRSAGLLALSLGVDHCLVKPPDLRELDLHLRNLHRRLSERVLAGVAAPRRPDGGRAVWRFDPGRWTLTAPGGHSVSLSAAEFHLIRHLMARAGQVATRAELQTALDRRRSDLSSRNLDMIVSRLRKKVVNCCRERLPIRSARGVGYVFVGPCRVDDERPLPLQQPAANTPMPMTA